LIAHLDCDFVQPYAIAAHLTTLRGEYSFAKHRSNPIAEKAGTLRSEQCQRVLDIIQKHLLKQNELVFLLGDFNAFPSEACIRAILENEGLFTRLLPCNPMPTHFDAPEPIDHILVHAGNKRVEYDCWIADSPSAKLASDHLPVVADVIIYPKSSPRTQTMGAGVYQLIEEDL
jgi:endonuclease/exonuclease/phosphatase (EEP) superfamily protein YafD